MRSKYLLFIIILSLLPLFNIFSTEKLNHTHDGLVHLARIGAYYKALGDGQIPVRWAGDLNYGNGMPLFNFMYQVPYLISSFFVFLGFSLVNSFKITLSLSYVLSGIFMFLFAKEFFKEDKKAFFVTIFYQFAPFRFIEILERGSFGEVYVYTFFPLVLFGIISMFNKYDYLKFILTSFASAFLILSHNSLSLVFFAASIMFVLFFSKKRKDLIIALCSLFFGLLLSSFYWLPAILEHKYTYGDLFMKNVYLSNFPPLQNFFIPSFFNDPNLRTNNIPVQFGIFHVVSILISLFILVKGKTDTLLKKIIYYSLFLTFTAIFFMQPISNLFWEKLPLLRQFQFPWRFLALSSFALSLLSVSFFSFDFFKRKTAFFLIIVLVVISTVVYWTPPEGYDKIEEKYYWNFPLNTTYYGETDVIWSAGPAKSFPKDRIDLIGGKASISNFSKKSNVQTFSVNADNNSQFVSHTQFFPGWKVYIDNKPTQVQFQDQNWRGLIVFYVPQGAHNVKIIFEETKIRLIADFVSLFSLIFLLGNIFLRKKLLWE